jgi:spermidine synthase
MASRTRDAVVFPLFFCSGFCALIYETVWVRQLVLSFGITIHAISAVLAAYMFGLSLGAAWIGRRVPGIRNPLRLYGWFEGAIAAYAVGLYGILAVALARIIHFTHTTIPGSPAALYVVRFLLAFVLLAVPTTLMGGTLPLLGQIVSRGTTRAGSRVGWLYGLNTLGAVAGAGVAGFWMLKNLGIFETTMVAAGVNFAIAGIALVASRRDIMSDVPVRLGSASVPANQVDDKTPSAMRDLVRVVAFLTGFAALSYEVMWNRTLLLYVHNSTYAFSMILMIYLLGVGSGSLVYARKAYTWTSVRMLGAIQLSIALSVWLSIYITGSLRPLLSGVVRVIGAASWPAALVDITCGTALVVFVPTFFMGLGFPMAATLATPEGADVGESLGSFYAVNTLGNILGSLVTGLALLAILGLRNSFAVSVCCNLLAGFLCLTWPWRSAKRFVLAGALTMAGVVGFLGTVSPDVFRRPYEKFGKVLYYKEESTDTVIVIEGRKNGQRAIRYSDGRGTAGTNTDSANRLYAHIPMLLHPHPDDVLSIGFGVGNTLSALAQWDPRRLLCVELSPAVLETAKYFWTNRQVLETPGLEIRIDDGRNFLLTSGQRFDVVQLEPPEIHTAGVVNLYTREFYELVRRDLKPRGIVAQWLNVILMPEFEMKMLIRTMQQVFPYTTLWAGAGWWDMTLIGSMEPIALSADRMTASVARPRVRADLERVGLSGAEDMLAHHVLSPDSVHAYTRNVPIVTDDRTYVDFSVPQSPEAGFGLFLYQTNQDVPEAEARERIHQRLELLAGRESPEYLLDFRGVPDLQRARLQASLAAAVDAQRRQSRNELFNER